MELLMKVILLACGCTTSLALPILQESQLPTQKTREMFDSGKFQTFEMIESSNKGVRKVLLEGDIVPKTFRSVTKCTNCLWDISASGMVNVPYVVSSIYSDTEKWLIDDALQEFETMTCMKFVLRSTEADYLYLDSLQGCYSYIARTGGKQIVSLDKAGCMTTGIIQHEILHTLGFYHEHTRSDRDNYVNITEENVIPGFLNNFIKADTNNLDLAYDYSSVMHYHNTAFSISSTKPTIVPKPNPTVPIGKASEISHLDLKKLNKLYNCSLCRTKLTDPSGSFSSDDNSFGPNGDTCLWLIQTTSSKKVYLELSDFNITQSTGCANSYIKIYNGRDKMSEVLLDKTCGVVMFPPLISSSNYMLLEFASDEQPVVSRFKATYKFVPDGGSFTMDDGEVTSPKFPLRYPNNADILWSIMAPQGYVVSLKFIYFRLQWSSTCSLDYLNIIDGISTTSPVLATFCGPQLPSPVVSTGNVMMLYMHTNNDTSYYGFMASYRFVVPV